MKKYRLLFEGKNCLIKNNGGRKKAGFFTTRFLEAKTTGDAEKKARDLISVELNDILLNEVSDPPSLTAEEIIEIESFEDNLVPGKGFTWFFEGEDPQNSANVV